MERKAGILLKSEVSTRDFFFRDDFYSLPRLIDHGDLQRTREMFRNIFYQRTSQCHFVWFFFFWKEIVQDADDVFFFLSGRCVKRGQSRKKRQLEGCNTCTCAGSSLPRRSNQFTCKWVKVQGFCPVEQTLAGSNDNEFRWCIRNTSKNMRTWDTSQGLKYISSDLYFLSALCSYKLDLDYFLACRFFLNILDEKSHWQHSYWAMRNSALSLKFICCWESPRRTQPVLFFSFRGKTKKLGKLSRSRTVCGVNLSCMFLKPNGLNNRHAVFQNENRTGLNLIQFFFFFFWWILSKIKSPKNVKVFVGHGPIARSAGISWSP